MPKTKKQQPFWLGGAAACMAATCTHPLDQTKYRMQVMHNPHNMFRVLVHFASRDGIPSLWTGLTASWTRQLSYSTARFGLYNYFAGLAKQRTGKTQLSSPWEIACSGVAGGLAGLVGNPTEVALVRMCADGAKKPSDRFGYRNAIDALIKIGQNEGVRTFSRGLTPNVVRSVLMNASQIATYSAAKRKLLATPSLGLQEGILTHFLASLVAGTVATTVCAPADVLKSRIQSATASKGAKPSLASIITDLFRKEGPGIFFRGWTPAWTRLAPNTVLMFMFLEQLQKLVGISVSKPETASEAAAVGKAKLQVKS